MRALAFTHFCHNWCALLRAAACACWAQCACARAPAGGTAADASNAHTWPGAPRSHARRFHFTMLSWLPSYFSSRFSMDLIHTSSTALFPPLAGIAASAAAGPLAGGCGMNSQLSMACGTPTGSCLHFCAKLSVEEQYYFTQFSAKLQVAAGGGSTGHRAHSMWCTHAPCAMWGACGAQCALHTHPAPNFSLAACPCVRLGKPCTQTRS